jgi:hypothetical protein
MTMNVLRKLWWGLYPLNKSFWGFYIFGGVGVMLLSAFLGALILTEFPQLRPIVYILGLCIMWSYWAVATVGVWRSANVYAGDVSIGPIAAKCVVLFVAGSFVFRLVDGGALLTVGRTMSSWNWMFH